jgi:hypothetical protein
MASGEGSVGLVGSSECTFGDAASEGTVRGKARLVHKSAAEAAAGADSYISKALGLFKGLIYVRYNDHVVFNRGMALAMAPVIREATGWLIYECPEYITLTFDRDGGPPNMKGDPKATGLALIRSDILEFQRLDELLALQRNLEHNLNSQGALKTNRVCVSRQRNEKLTRKEGTNC